MRALIALALALPTVAVAASPDGAAIFTRCAACHTATGAGVPGAYPPLNADVRALAAKPEGRRYLALVVLKGLNGPLEVEGRAFRNVMPAQSGLDEAAVASVLNHVGTKIAHAGPPFKPFTAAEVAGYAKGAEAVTPGELARLHATLVGK